MRTTALLDRQAEAVVAEAYPGVFIHASRRWSGSSGKLVTHSWGAGGTHEWGTGPTHEWVTLATYDGLSRLPLVSFLDDLQDLPLRQQGSPRWASYSGMIFRYDLELTTDTVRIFEVGAWCTEKVRAV